MTIKKVQIILMVIFLLFAFSGVISSVFADATLPYQCGTTGQYKPTDTINEIGTAIGCIPVDNPVGFISFLLSYALMASGGIIVLMIILTGYNVLTSGGNPEKISAAKENIISLLTGLIFISFSLVLLKTIGASVLGLAGF